MTYHWFSSYTGEIATTAQMIKSVIWEIVHPRMHPNLNRFKYALSWEFSWRGY